MKRPLEEVQGSKNVSGKKVKGEKRKSKAGDKSNQDIKSFFKKNEEVTSTKNQ